jgi:CRISPR/Cas system CMR-associated protein Cmr5 small subunit
MKKSRIEKLIPIANQALQSLPNDKRIVQADGTIKKKYDGKVAAFGVTVALSGLRPALAMYYNESGDVKTRSILDMITKIIVADKKYTALSKDTAEELVKHALNADTDIDKLKPYVLEAAIALKQVIRTYELKD